mgnify:FL=1
MLKRILQICFIFIGGALGMGILPDLLPLINIDNELITNPISSAILGAIIFYLITFWLVDYVAHFIKWIEEQLLIAPITDIIFGSMGLLIGLLLAFLITLPLNQVPIPILNTVSPIHLT